MGSLRLTTNIQPCKSGRLWKFWVRCLHWWQKFISKKNVTVGLFFSCFFLNKANSLTHVMRSTRYEQNNMFRLSSSIHWGKLFRCTRSMCLGRTWSNMRMAAHVHVYACVCLCGACHRGAAKKGHTAKTTNDITIFSGLGYMTWEATWPAR